MIANQKEKIGKKRKYVVGKKKIKKEEETTNSK